MHDVYQVISYLLFLIFWRHADIKWLLSIHVESEHIRLYISICICQKKKKTVGESTFVEK